MNAPYKFLIVSLPRSMSYWLSKHFGFDHDASADLLQGKWEKKSEGLCDTGIYMLSKEDQAKLIDESTKIVCINRYHHDVTDSLVAKLPGSERARVHEFVTRLQRGAWDFLHDREFVEFDFPLAAWSVLAIQEYFHPTILTSELEERRDLMTDPEYVKRIQSFLPDVFGKPTETTQ